MILIGIVGCDVLYNPAANVEGNQFEIINQSWGVGPLDVFVKDTSSSVGLMVKNVEWGNSHKRYVSIKPFHEYEIIFIVPKYQWGDEYYKLQYRVTYYVLPEDEIITIESPREVNSWTYDWIELKK